MKPLQALDASAIAGVFTDIDDTLTSDGRLTGEAYQALCALAAAGIVVVPVTGRSAGWAHMIAKTWPVRAVIGWCFGGHVAFRAAMLPEIRATACCYATGVHNGELGASREAGSLERANEIRGELLLVWGRNDPHIPADGRARIHRHLDDAGVRFEARLYDAEHTFMRDEGARFDAEAADRAFGAVLDLFRRM